MESNDLSVYYVILAFALLAFLFPAGIFLLSYLMSPSKERRTVTSPSDRAERINTRYFVGLLGGTVFCLMGFMSLPVVSALRSENGSGFFLLALVFLFFSFGLAYAFRKGDLSWLQSFSTDSSNKTTSANESN